MERKIEDKNILEKFTEEFLKMKRDKSHNDQIERWVNYIKTHEDWKKIYTQFIDIVKAQNIPTYFALFLNRKGTTLYD